MRARALFLDRDGTLVRPRHFPTRPAHLVLYGGMGPGLRALQRLGFRLVVVTNQSGIARGYLTEADLRRMHDHLARELLRKGVHIREFYHCPHHPQGVVPALAVRCACRKPRSGMLRRAALELHLDLARSWLVGDILDDVEAGNRAGCRTVLVDLGTEAPPALATREPTLVARDTPHALRLIREVEEHGHALAPAYCPPAWSPADHQTPFRRVHEGTPRILPLSRRATSEPMVPGRKP